jgi:hypothetical protein
VQVAPWLHAAHVPLALQNPDAAPELQGVPAALKVWSVQTGVPLEQVTVAVAAQELVEVQVAPWVQAVQMPAALHTWFVPQLDPAATKVRAVHTGVPPEHSMVSVAAHAFPEPVQAAPWAQALQVPDPLHTPAAPAPALQAVPAGLKVWSWHTGEPLEHSVVAVAMQSFDGAQAAPWLHAVQVPSELHTPVVVPEVHGVPAGLAVWSTQVGVPLEQSRVAVAAHGFDEVQAAPWLQAAHVPVALHTPATPFASQAVPAGLNVSSLHMGAPLEQSIVAPVAQGFVVGQEVPAVQAVQAPAGLHTPVMLPAVHGVPAALKV